MYFSISSLWKVNTEYLIKILENFLRVQKTLPSGNLGFPAKSMEKKFVTIHIVQFGWNVLEVSFYFFPDDLVKFQKHNE